MGHLILATTTDEVKELFALASIILEQTRLASDDMASLVEDISDEKDYLSRSVRLPNLSQTSITCMLQSR